MSRHDTCKPIIILALFLLFSGMYTTTPSAGELYVKKIIPNQGVTGQNLKVIIVGRGFRRKDTRVMMIPEISVQSRIIHSLEIPGDDSWHDMVLSGQMIYLVGIHAGLQIIDIRTPPEVKIIGSLELPGWTKKICVSGYIAYVAAKDAGLYAIDVSDPENPVVLSKIETSEQDFSQSSNILIMNNIAYVTLPPSALSEQEDGIFYIIDVKDLSDVRVIGSLNIPKEINEIDISGDTVFIAAREDGFICIDVSDAANPKNAGSIDIPSSAYHFGISEETAYVGNGNGNIIAIDISDPENMNIVDDSRLNHYLSVRDIIISEETAYINGGHCLWKINIEDQDKMKIAGVTDLPVSSRDMAIDDNIAYVSAGEQGFHAIDITNLENPGANISGIIESVMIPNATKVNILDDKAYIASGYQGLYTIDIKNPECPETLSSFNTTVSNEMKDIAVLNDIVYATTGNEMQIIDISNPYQPWSIGSVNTSHTSKLLTISNNTLFVSLYYRTFFMLDYTNHFYLLTFDVSNPENPLFIGTTDGQNHQNGYIVNMLSSGNMVYLASYSSSSLGGVQMDHSNFFVIDGNIPSDPKIIGRVSHNGKTGGLDVSGNTAFVTFTGDMFFDIPASPLLSAIDISDPQQPVIIGEIDLPAYGSLTVSNDKAYILPVFSSQIYIVDISNPCDMQIMGEMVTPSIIKDLSISGDLAYAAAGNSGLLILPLPAEAECVRTLPPFIILATLPGPKKAGVYTIRVLNDNTYADLPGAVTFIQPPIERVRIKNRDF